MTLINHNAETGNITINWFEKPMRSDVDYIKQLGFRFEPVHQYYYCKYTPEVMQQVQQHLNKNAQKQPVNKPKTLKNKPENFGITQNVTIFEVQYVLQKTS